MHPRAIFPASIVAVSLVAGLACGSAQETGDGDGGLDATTGFVGLDATPDALSEADARSKDGSVKDSGDGGLGDANKPDALTPGAARTILVTVGLQLDIYDLAGNLLKTVPVPAAHYEAGEGLRGVVEDAAGRVHIFAGTFAPLLATWDGANWSSRKIGGTPNVVHYGHLAAVGDTVLATGMNIRFTRYNTVTQVVDYISGPVPGSATYTDIQKGADGKLYAVDSFDTTVEIDPVTLKEVRSLPISPSPDLIAPDATGLMHGAWTQSGTLFGFPVGSPATQVGPLGIMDFQDIDIAADGTFIFCGNGKLVVGHLGSPQLVTKTLPFNNAFCSFGFVAR